MNVATQVATDQSTLAASDQFVSARVELSDSAKNLNIAGSGTFSAAGVGSGGQIVYTASGGAISGVVTIAQPGKNYKVGDLIVDTQGNNDAVLRAITVNGTGGLTAVSIIYGGTQYAGIGVTGILRPTNSNFAGIFQLTGALTGDVVFLLTPGSYSNNAKSFIACNNTTGMHTVTVQMSGQAGGVSTNTAIGSGVALTQGAANSTATLIFTDGVNDVWPVP